MYLCERNYKTVKRATETTIKENDQTALSSTIFTWRITDIQRTSDSFDIGFNIPEPFIKRFDGLRA